MRQPRQKQTSHFRDDHASGADFCRTLKNDMGRLYLLAFLLTTNHEEAERCFVRTVQEIPENKTVFKEWVRTWTQHALIKIAIGSVLREPRMNMQARDQWWERQSEAGVAATIEAITQLASLDRFVFVMSVLERYSAKECSLLLDCTVETVIEARMRALDALRSPQPILMIEAERASNCLGAYA
jgi:DNA-directed RNA polymerase specialized sigma24 family protein